MKMSDYLNIKDLSSPGPAEPMTAKLTPKEEYALNQTVFEDPETIQAIEEYVKEILLYGRTPGMDRQLADDIEGIASRHKDRFEPEISEGA